MTNKTIHIAYSLHPIANIRRANNIPMIYSVCCLVPCYLLPNSDDTCMVIHALAGSYMLDYVKEQAEKLQKHANFHIGVITIENDEGVYATHQKASEQIYNELFFA